MPYPLLNCPNCGSRAGDYRAGSKSDAYPKEENHRRFELLGGRICLILHLGTENLARKFIQQ